MDLPACDIPALLAELRAGRLVVLVDDRDREADCELLVAASHATPAALNFMAAHGRGLICLALTRARVQALGLPAMAAFGARPRETAFTVSIEARDGVTTGISVADRARTVAVAIDPALGPDHIVTPGHVFPLVARDGGVLVREGYTEAAVDLARLARLTPAGVLCQVMRDDGTMARAADMANFAAAHGLCIGRIADLVAYRRRTERLVVRVAEGRVTALGAEWRLLTYAEQPAGRQHRALLRGDPAAGGLHVHVQRPLCDLLAEGGPAPLHDALRRLAGGGTVLLLHEEIGAEDGAEARAAAIAAQIMDDLRDAAVRTMAG